MKGKEYPLQELFDNWDHLFFEDKTQQASLQ